MSEKIDLMKLNDRHEYEQFKDVNFSGKHITKIKFNNISFLNCDFTGAVISVCNFNERCEFANCNFTGATILNCVFNDTTLLECNFSKTKLEDVTIEDTCNLIRNNFSDDCIINNFKVRGTEVEDINDLILETEEELETITTDTQETSATSGTATESVEEELEERDDRQDPVIDYKLYNALFPEVLKLYPELKKAEYGYEITVDEVEFSISPDNDSYAWRYVFIVRDTDDSLGSDVVTVDTTKEITFDTLKEAFEQMVKGEASLIADRTDSQVIKSSLKKFTQEVFKDSNVINESLTNDTLLVSVYDSPTDVNGLFTAGYDMTTNTTCVIVGKPFLTNNIAEGNKVRETIKQFGFVINNDILNMSNEELFEFSNLHPYTCFVYEHSDLVDRVNARTCGKDLIIVVK